MKKEMYLTSLLIGALVLMVFLAFFEVIPLPHPLPDVEEKTVDIIHFDLYDNASGSLVQGAMFARMSEVTHRVVITARHWISARDFGGVGFSIPREWVVVEKYNSYPGGEMDNCHERYISEWHTGSIIQYNTRVEITPDINSSGPGKGKEGYVVIVLQPKNDEHPPEECRICVSVGSEMKNGTRIIHPTFGEYSVNFSNIQKSPEVPHASTGQCVDDLDRYYNSKKVLSRVQVA